LFAAGPVKVSKSDICTKSFMQALLQGDCSELALPWIEFSFLFFQ
jgi:hypothetical protein